MILQIKVFKVSKITFIQLSLEYFYIPKTDVKLYFVIINLIISPHHKSWIRTQSYKTNNLFSYYVNDKLMRS